MTERPTPSTFNLRSTLLLLLAFRVPAYSGESLRVGLATRDVTPEGPIWLSGYSARNRPSERVDQRLLVQAAAFEDDRGERAILVSLDNCEVSGQFSVASDSSLSR